MHGREHDPTQEQDGAHEALLLKLSTQIVDGAKVDWNDAQELPTVLRQQLRQIELLAGGFQGPATPVADSAPQATDDLLGVGACFGPLRIRGLLGRGSFGQVYRAWDAELEREVALKLIADRGRPRSEILREARLMARINHPNVLKVYGALQDRERIGFAFELIEGETMETWIARHDALGPHALIAIGLELCAALCALHQDQILHGDLKPGNILRHSSGRWIVADFGSCQRAEDSGISSGTPRYMAPELFESALPDAAADQYALGVVLFRLASRRFPVEGESVGVIAGAHARGERTPLIDLRPDLPLPLIHAIERSLAPAPEQRFASVGKLAAALSAVIAEPHSPDSRSPRWRRVWPWLSAGLLLVVAVFLSNGWTSGVRSTELSWLLNQDGAVRILQQGDRLDVDQGLALQLQLDRPRHVYIVNQDGDGARFALFPLAGAELRNPLPAGKHVLPGKVDGASVDWRLTSRGGREYFVVVLSDQPIVELAELQLTEAGAIDSTSLAMSSTVRGVGGLSERTETVAPDFSWLEALRTRYPRARFEQFELASP